MALQKNITLTPEQEKFVRANYNRMGNQELADALKVTKGKIVANKQVMELRGKNCKKTARIPEVSRPGYFDLREYAKSMAI